MSLRLLGTREERLALREPFATSLGEVSDLTCIRVDLTATADRFPDGHRLVTSGWATPQRLTGETRTSIERDLNTTIPDLARHFGVEDWEAFLDRLERAPAGPSARAAVDLAVHRFAARAQGVSLPELLGIPPRAVQTDVTVGIGSVDDAVAAARCRAAAGFTSLKLKVGAAADVPAEIPAEVARICAVSRALPGAVALCLDANQGWSRSTAAAVLDALDRAGVALAYVEQPLPAADAGGLAWLRRRTPYPLMADESAGSVADVRRLGDDEAVDLINVKTAKFGGIRAARRVLAEAGSRGLGVRVGSMMEAPPAVAASLLLAAESAPKDVHDLDAAWWTRNASPDMRPGVRYRPPQVEYDDVDDATHARPAAR